MTYFNCKLSRSLSENGHRSEGKLFLGIFVYHLRRIVDLFNENDREIGQKLAFRTNAWMHVVRATQELLH